MNKNDEPSNTTNIIKTLINHGLLDNEHHIDIKKLTGGYHNYVYRLRNNDGIDWVIKQYVTHSDVPLFPVLPDHESGALKVLKETGVTPKYIDFLPHVEKGAILIYEFVEGEQWQKDTSLVARMLAKVHQTKSNQTLQNAFRQLPYKPADLIQQTQSILGLMQDSSEATSQLDRYLIDSHWSEQIECSLIHTDCGPGNIVIGNQQSVLIDWQCPGLGDPIEDLINFSSPSMQILYGLSPLIDQQLSEFFDAYDNPEAITRLNTNGIYYRARFVAYCFYREESLRINQPEISALYRQALTADLELMNNI